MGMIPAYEIDSTADLPSPAPAFQVNTLQRAQDFGNSGIL
jgi:hypothetical protein